MSWQIQAILVVVAVGFLSLLLVVDVRAETGCKAKCQKQQHRQHQPRKTRYAVKAIKTIAIPTHIPDSRRRALMRMQPQYQRWAFTGFRAVSIYNASYEG